jgi:hypothetical protein
MFITQKTAKIFLLAFIFCLLPLPTKAQEVTPDGTTATSVNSADGSNFDINGAQFISNTFGRGNAGNITIKAGDTVSFDGTTPQKIPSAVFTTVEAGAKGKGGDINITANNLSLTNGGELNAFVR